jgi:TonB-dependent receptor
MGRIVSSETGAPLAFASLALHRLSSAADTVGTLVGGVLSKPDGSYRMPTPPGLYMINATYVAYRTKKITGIAAAPGAVVTADIALVPTAVQLETIHVNSYRIENSDASILAHRKKAAAVSDGVSAQQIAQTTDADAAEVLRRVTGLSVVGGRYIYVRGLGERYSSTQVDGATIGTPEANKRVVPLDLFAASLLDNVVIQKTYTPDKPGDFGGGVVNINTRDFPGKRVWGLTISSGYEKPTTGADFFTYAGGRYDFLGMDDGARRMPDLIRKIAAHTLVTDRAFSADTLEMLGESFKNTWKKRTRSAPVPYSVKSSYGNEFSLFGHSLGILAAATISNAYRTTHSQEIRNDVDQGLLTRQRDYAAVTSERKILWGWIGNASYRLGNRNTVALRTMYNRSAEDEVRFLEGPNADHGKYWRNARYRYVERGMFAGSVAVSQCVPALGNATVDARFSYSHSTRDEPDRREYNYEQNDKYALVDGEVVDTLHVWRLSTKTFDLRPTRHFGTMAEDQRLPEVNASFPFHQWSDLEAKLKVGGSYEDKDREFTWRRFFYREPDGLAPARSDSVFALPLEVLLSPAMVGGTRSFFRLNENTFPNTDNYRASQNIGAVYAMMDLPLLPRLRTAFGVRLEDADIALKSYDPFGMADSLATSELSDTDWLPSANITYAVSKQANLRVAYSGTINRPDLRELSPFFIIDIEGGYMQTGNPDLKRAWIDSYDLRYEAFPSPDELLAVSGFYKNMRDPIEKTIVGGSAPLVMPQNIERGRLYGGEFELRYGLGHPRNDLHGFAATGNLTLVHSETDAGNAGIQHTAKPPLAGQSPYVVNLGLHFAAPGGRTSASVFYNRLGRRLDTLGVQDDPDVYEMPLQVMDVNVQHQRRGYRIKCAIENILNGEVRHAQQQPLDGAWKPAHVTKSGRSFSLAVSMGS